jgi:hypothetical protein
MKLFVFVMGKALINDQSLELRWMKLQQFLLAVQESKKKIKHATIHSTKILRTFEIHKLKVSTAAIF